MALILPRCSRWTRTAFSCLCSSRPTVLGKDGVRRAPMAALQFTSRRDKSDGSSWSRSLKSNPVLGMGPTRSRTSMRSSNPCRKAVVQLANQRARLPKRVRAQARNRVMVLTTMTRMTTMTTAVFVPVTRTRKQLITKPFCAC